MKIDPVSLNVRFILWTFCEQRPVFKKVDSYFAYHNLPFSADWEIEPLLRLCVWFNFANYFQRCSRTIFNCFHG